MRVARIKVGQPKPLADSRFCVEAFWLSLCVRFALVNLAKGWLELRSTRPNFMSRNGAIWANYMSFVLKTCKRDADIALKEAEESQNRRQISPSKIFVMKSTLELFKFGFQMRRMQGHEGVEERSKFRDRAHERWSEASASVREELYIRRRDILQTGETAEDAKMFKTTFNDPAANILKEWKTLEDLVMDEAFIAPLSSEEKLEVITAMKREFYNAAGHFYRCPNGHIYTIGDCGGATETSRCPECGEMIGGSGHQLLGTNQRDLEFERIAREQGGYGRSPFTWNQF